MAVVLVAQATQLGLIAATVRIAAGRLLGLVSRCLRGRRFRFSSRGVAALAAASGYVR